MQSVFRVYYLSEGGGVRAIQLAPSGSSEEVLSTSFRIYYIKSKRDMWDNQDKPLFSFINL